MVAAMKAIVRSNEQRMPAELLLNMWRPTGEWPGSATPNRTNAAAATLVRRPDA
jgi:hypothetical protein